MTNPTVRIHDLESNEVIDREMTAVELKEYKAAQLAGKLLRDEEKTKAAEKQALLDRLGITADEAKLLLG